MACALKAVQRPSVPGLVPDDKRNKRCRLSEVHNTAICSFQIPPRNDLGRKQWIAEHNQTRVNDFAIAYLMNNVKLRCAFVFGLKGRSRF